MPCDNDFDWACDERYVADCLATFRLSFMSFFTNSRPWAAKLPLDSGVFSLRQNFSSWFPVNWTETSSNAKNFRPNLSYRFLNLSLSVCLSLTHTHSFSLSLTHAHTQPHSISLSLSHTNTYTFQVLSENKRMICPFSTRLCLKRLNLACESCLGGGLLASKGCHLQWRILESKL